MALHAAQRACDVVCPAFVVDPALLRGPRMGAPLTSVLFFGRRGVARRAARLRQRPGRPRGRELAAKRSSSWLAKRLTPGPCFQSVDTSRTQSLATQAERLLRAPGSTLHASIDHVYFGADEMLRADGSPYQVFIGVPPSLDGPLHGAATAAAANGSEEEVLKPRAVGDTEQTRKPETYGFESSPNVPEVSEAIGDSRLQGFARSEHRRVRPDARTFRP